MARRYVPTLVALVFVAMAGLLLWNTHAEIFPCRRADYAYGAGTMNYGEPKRADAKCSLRYVTDPEYARYNAKIEPGGWALVALLWLLVPAAIGGAIGGAIVNPKKRPRAGDDRPSDA